MKLASVMSSVNAVYTLEVWSYVINDGKVLELYLIVCSGITVHAFDRSINVLLTT